MNATPGQPQRAGSASPGLFRQLVVKPDHPVFLQVGDDPTQFKSTLLGIDFNDFLIVKLPPQLEARGKLTEGSDLIVRMEHGGTLFGFKVTLLSLVTHPARVLFLSYPADIEHIPLRKNKRVKCLIPTLIEYEGVSLNGFVYDISKGGCRCAVTEAGGQAPREMGTQVAIFIQTDGMHIERLIGQIRNCQTRGQVDTFGMSFNNDSETTTVASQFVDNLKRTEQRCARADAANCDGIAAIRRTQGFESSTVSVLPGEDAAIPPGKTIEFQFVGDHQLEATTVLCIDARRTIISGYRITSRSRAIPRAGTGLKAFFEHQGAIYSFTSQVTKFVTRPKPLLFLAYPKKFEVFQMRAHKRIHCLMPSVIENLRFKSQCYIRDLSSSGCCVVAGEGDDSVIQDLMIGDAFNVFLPMDGLSHDTFRAKVRRIVRQGDTLTVGMAFDCDKDAQLRLDRVVNRLLAVDVAVSTV